MLQLASTTRYCAMKLMTCTSYAKVFNVLDPESMKPGFDIFLECGLAELAMTIEASITKPKKDKKRKKLKLK